MPHSRRATVVCLAMFATAFFGWSLAGADATRSMQRSDLKMQSIGALEFGPGGVLFAGDSLGGAVFAIDVGAAESSASTVKLAKVADLDEKLGAMLGTSARDVFIKDMAVHPSSGAVYLSIMRGRGPDAKPVLMRLSGDGIAEVPLDSRLHSKLVLTDAPAADAKVYSWDSRTLTITDLEFIAGELYIAGLSNEEFASTLRRTPFPFEDPISTTSLEIYHGAHGAYETFAPVFTFMPFELRGQPHLLASYLCTPLVTFPLEALRTEKKLRGKTIAELGWGNVPIDMLAYEYGGDEYVLMTNTARGAMKLKASDIRAAHERDGITTKVGARTGVDYEGSPLGHVVRIADLDAENILVLARDVESGSLSLAPRPKQYL